MSHAYTRFHQPIVDYATGTLSGHVDHRMGNLVYDKIGERAFTISLHQPWQLVKAGENFYYPAGGVLDAVMREFDDTRVGFDLADSPFGALPSPNTSYALGLENFSLRDFADGYIYQRWFSKCEGVATDPNVVTWDNLAEVVANIENPAARKTLTTPQAVAAGAANSAKIPLRFRYFAVASDAGANRSSVVGQHLADVFDCFSGSLPERATRQ